MAKATQRTLDLRFPVGGVVKRSGYQWQPPFTTPSAQNVRPFDTYEGRERGGSRPGLEKFSATQFGGGSPIQLLAPVWYVEPTGENATQKLIVVSGGIGYLGVLNGTLTFTVFTGERSVQTEAAADIISEDGADTVVVDYGNLNPALSKIQGAQRGLMFYFADHGDSATEGDDGEISGGNVLAADSVSDWTALGIDLATHVVVVTAGTGSAVESGTYRIASVASGSLTLDATLTAGACSYDVARGVKSLNLTTGLPSLHLPTAGTVPLHCPSICLYRDRLVLAGPSHLWYAARQGDPTDFNYGADPSDMQRAIPGISADAGLVGEPIVGLTPHSDDYLIFDCQNSLWILRGDPVFGGQFGALSREIGIVAADAWCRTPDGTLVFLSRDGVYLIAPGGQGYPVAVSREVLPRELLDVDALNNVVCLAYDSRDRGIHVDITPTNGSTGTHYWIDWTTKTFWTVVLSSAHQPTATAAFAADPSQRRYIVAGGFDGYLRYYDQTAGDDDGATFTSLVQIGPFRLGASPLECGMLLKLDADLDAESGSLTWKLRAAGTPEGAIAAAVAITGTFVAGSNRGGWTRWRDVAAVVELTSTGRWAMEGLFAVVGPGGLAR